MRPKANSDGELVPMDVPAEDLRDEANLRASKLGYCTRRGEPPYRTKIMMAPPTKRYEQEYIRIFGHD